MRDYRDITIWENTERGRVLTQFRADLISYFERSQSHWNLPDRIEEDGAPEYREAINLSLKRVHDILSAARVPIWVEHIEPPLRGGRAVKLDVVMNVFELHQFRIPASRLVDVIDRGIGAYEADRTAAFIRTVNPFWWMGRAFRWIGRLPIALLGELGFDRDAIEKKTWSKILKGVVTVLTATGTILTILNLLGWLDRFRSALGLLSKTRP